MERIQGLRVPRVPELVSSRIQSQFSLTTKPPLFLLGQLIQENKKIKEVWGSLLHGSTGRNEEELHGGM